MMPDLGKYGDTVLSAYAVSLVFLVGIVALSWVRSRHVKRQLDAAEARRGKGR